MRTMGAFFMMMMKGKMKGMGKGLPRKDFPAVQKVWVGGLPDGTDYKAVLAHFKQAGDAKFARILPTVQSADSGTTAYVAYGPPEEATAAIDLLNGSIFEDRVAIQVGVWSKRLAEEESRGSLFEDTSQNNV